MSGYSLNTQSQLMCPHGGQVQIISSNTSTKSQQAPNATMSDTFLVTGCPFTLPGPKPSPCIEVRWLVPDTRVKINGNLTLSQTSTGMCFSAEQIPQGPVIIMNTQLRVQSQ